MNLRHALAAAALACLGAVAAAAPITYTFTGTVAVQAGDGSSEQRALVLTVAGDTTNVSLVNDPAGDYFYADAGLSYSMTLGGVGYTFDPGYGGLYLYNVVPAGVVGFGFAGLGDWWIQSVGPALSTYDLASDVGPLAGGLSAPVASLLTLNGTGTPDFTLNFSALADARFASAVAQQVPEPASYALAGLALAGLALTRRRRA